MALKPTLYKVDLQLVNTDSDIYENCKFTLAQHPSETPMRMMVRLMVYSLNYHPGLQFTKGLSTQDEPDLWQISDSLDVERWIEVGQASTERMRKGISKSRDVVLYAYGSEADIWWDKNQAAFKELPKIRIHKFSHQQLKHLDSMIDRKMSMMVSISGGDLYVNNEHHDVKLELEQLL